MAVYVETEIKLRVPAVEPARAKVQALGARLDRPRHFEDNLVFDDAARSLSGSGRVLRLRKTDAGAVLTLKGPRLEHEDVVKSREELEVSVSDAGSVQAMLEVLGYTPRFRYQKYRETWSLGEVEIVVDETPVGVFLEIEGSVADIHATAARLGFSQADYLTASYVSLYLASGGTGDMVFPAALMKAMVLAAGLGTRLRPLTRRLAKPALPVLNRPLLHWTLERLARHGVREVMLNLHYRGSSVVRAVGDGSQFGLRVSYSREREILGTGGGPRKVRRFFGDEPFLLVNGDVFFDFDLSQVMTRHRAAGAQATLVLMALPKGGSYSAVVSGRDGRIRSLAGLPHPAAGTRSMFTGIHLLDPALLDRLPPGRSDSVRDLYLPMLARGESVHGLRLRGKWYDFGSPALYLGSQLALLPKSALIHPSARIGAGARILRSVIGAGVRVGAGATVRDSVLWDGVAVGAGARVRRVVLASGQVAQQERIEGMVILGRERLQVGL